MSYKVEDNTKRLLVIVAAVLILFGFAITVYSWQPDYKNKKSFESIDGASGKKVSVVFEEYGFEPNSSFIVLHDPPGFPAHIAVQNFGSGNWLVVLIRRNEKLFSESFDWHWEELSNQIVVAALLTDDESYQKDYFLLKDW